MTGISSFGLWTYNQRRASEVDPAIFCGCVQCIYCEWPWLHVCTAVRYVLSGGNYPFMALAMLKQARMSLIGRFEGGCGQHWCRPGVLLMKECPLSGLLPEELFLQNLVDILDRHEPELVVSRNERYWAVCACVHSVYMCV